VEDWSAGQAAYDEIRVVTKDLADGEGRAGRVFDDGEVGEGVFGDAEGAEDLVQLLGAADDWRC
jgi:hypothetical protein